MGQRLNTPVHDLQPQGHGQGRTVLHRAAESGLTAVVEKLISGGAEADVTDKRGLVRLGNAE